MVGALRKQNSSSVKICMEFEGAFTATGAGAHFRFAIQNPINFRSI